MTQIDRLYGLVGNTAIKAPIRVATTGPITLSGEQTIDGIAVVSGDRVLVKDQADAKENGIYNADTGDWDRAADFDGNLDITTGTLMIVNYGTANANTYWRVSSVSPITIDTSDIAIAAAFVSDSASISFLQSGTGAVARTMQSKERDIVSVKDFGATGDGTTDDTAAIQAAHTAHRNVHYPRGTYKITDRIEVIWTDYIGITADEGVLIDASTSTDDFGMFIGGTAIPSGGISYLYDRTLRTGGYPLLANVAAGARTFTVSASLGLAEGDVARISSSDLFTPAYAAAYSGEMCRVLSVSGTTVTATAPLNAAYLAATTKIFKIGCPKVTLRNIRMLRATANTGISVWEASDIDIENVGVEGATLQGLQIAYCLGGQVRNCHTIKTYATTNGYGISISTCQRVNISGNNAERARHAMSVNGYEPCRDITINSNDFRSYSSAANSTYALDVHGNAERIIIIGNTVDGGMNVSCGNVTIENNIVVQDQALFGILLSVQKSSDYINIRGNTVTCSGGFGHIAVRSEQASCTTDVVDISNNETSGIISNTHGGIWLSPQNTTGTGWTINNLFCDDNKVSVGAGSGGTSEALFISDGTLGASYNVTVNYMRVSGGRYKGNTGRAMELRPKAGSGICDMNGTYVYGDSSYPLYSTDFDYFNIENCWIVGDGVTTSNIDVRPDLVAKVINSKFKDLIGSGGIDLRPGVQSVLYGNSFYSVIGSIYAEGIVSGSESGGMFTKPEAFLAAAPTTGTWERGARIWKTAPSSGSEPGWSCTASGTFSAATEGGTTTSGSKIITAMADTSDFVIGQFVDASAGFAVLTALRIIGKTATTLTVDRNANATGAATISTTDPVFKAMGNLA